MSRSIRWAYGVTTVPERRSKLLPRTLQSLQLGGFDKPRLFIDGGDDPLSWSREFGVDVTCRFPNVRAYGNWVLALAELYIRDPQAHRYAIFQDDFVTYKNLRTYLDKVEYAPKTYWNLYTFPKNQVLAPRIGLTARFHRGWYSSNQLGKGAVALVFDKSTVITLLTHQHMVERPLSVDKGHKNLDGGVVTALRKAGWKELVHNPSLVQHTGTVSSMGKMNWSPDSVATSFQGEDFDALDLLGEE